MRHILAIGFLTMSIIGYGQTTLEVNQVSMSTKAQVDSTLSGSLEKRLDSLKREEMRKIDQEAQQRGLNSLLEIQRENNKKQKIAAITRIAIGIALFGILVFGLRRRNTSGRPK